MKRVAFKIHADRSGWLRTTLWPINTKYDTHFRMIDMVMVCALVLGTVVVARFLIAH